MDKYVLEQIIQNRALRVALARESHYYFFLIYLPHYIKYTPAPFHRELFALTEDESIKTAVVTAFRGSGKSTIITLSYVLWAILGKQQKKFIYILGQTNRQVKQQFTNIKKELETNQLLRMDLGPFRDESDEWSSTLVIPKYGARISVASTEQSIRGSRHLQHRPDLIIADDIEDDGSVKTLEGRDKTHVWLTSDVIPAGDRNTRLIVIGNLLHEDAVLMRFKKDIQEGRLDGIYLEYPFLDEHGIPLWQSKFSTPELIAAEKLKMGSEKAYQREMMLKIISDADRVVHPEWIQYYDHIPNRSDRSNQYWFSATGIDLAISLKATADYTAMISAHVFGKGDNIQIYILPFPINEKLTFPQTIEKAKKLSVSLGDDHATKLYVEKVGYQESVAQELQKSGFPAEAIAIKGDKRERLSGVTPLIKMGNVVFPRTGCGPLVQQITGFGIEKHDDLADAFSLLIGEIMAKNHRRSSLPDFDNDLKYRPITYGLMEMQF